MTALCIVAFITALIATFLLLKVRLEVQLVLDGLSWQWNANITLLGGIVKLNLKKTAEKAKKEKEQAAAHGPAKAIERLGEFLEVLKAIAKHLPKFLIVEKFSTDAVIGLSDPMYTAVMYGTYWGFAGQLYSILHSFKLKSWHFDILPDFERGRLYVAHNSVYAARHWSILTAAIRILTREKTVRDFMRGSFARH